MVSATTLFIQLSGIACALGLLMGGALIGLAVLTGGNRIGKEPKQDPETRRFVEKRAQSMGLTAEQYMSKYYPGG